MSGRYTPAAIRNTFEVEVIDSDIECGCWGEETIEMKMVAICKFCMKEVDFENNYPQLSTCRCEWLKKLLIFNKK